ncbi:MAG TPA: leukotoxin LktA family filamentous adhesin, partial [Roseiarcus sp.]|nr:leukotoxin LktA family filamentous adhesin [Roseiarcus sp.]
MRSSALLPVAFVLFGASSAFGQAVNLGRAAGNAIIPDGRTATTLSGNGRVTNITTTTLRGGNAYNSFSQFREARGNVVNLVVPNAARNLVNVVTDGAVDIQGALNSYKNGVIGGNVVFADSYGFIVGKTGVVNVGALTVVTPAKSALDRLISANGAIDSKVANQIIHGDVPLSPDGSVSISGQIVAQHGVRINAHDVAVAGSIPEAERVARQKALFESTVNAVGLREGGAIVARHGGIEIVATNNIGVDGSLAAGGSRRHAASISLSAGHSVSIGASADIRATGRNSHVAIASGDDIAIAGAIAAKAAPGENAGRIDVSAVGDVSIAESAAFDAAGAGLKANGGAISIKPSGNLDVADGATFDASAGAFGNGGLVELSAGKVATIGDIRLNLGAPGGEAGTLLLDPWDLQIGGAAAGGSSTASDVTVDSSFSPSLITHGASVVLEADHSITIAAGGVIDTTLSGGQSGAIALTAPSISVLGGAQLLADAVGGGTAGAVTLKAIANAASAGVAQIEIGDSSGLAAVVKGGDILLQATATLAQATDHAIIAINSADVTAAGTLQAQATASGGTAVNAVAAVAS